MNARREAWRVANDAACTHLRHCQDCTGGYICPDAVALERAVQLTEPGMLAWDETPEEDDHTPAWLNALFDFALVVVILAAFGLGVLYGMGGGLL